MKQLDLFDDVDEPPPISNLARYGKHYTVDSYTNYAPLKYLTPGEMAEVHSFAIRNDGYALARMAAELDFHRLEHARWRRRHSGARGVAIISMWLLLSMAFWAGAILCVRHVWGLFS
ncbi:MAG: hypothetical protein HC794_09355 [Nitrospiraceae bacterium]|nr:hypothetical protein [Nitrospiraceae bacterium]